MNLVGGPTPQGKAILGSMLLSFGHVFAGGSSVKETILSHARLTSPDPMTGLGKSYKFKPVAFSAQVRTAQGIHSPTAKLAPRLAAMAFAATSSDMTPAKHQWQCQAGWGSSWTDYEQAENKLLEAAWTRQMWTTEELVVTMPGWPQHVVYLGTRLQQVNFETGRARTIRRIQVIEEGIPGGWMSRMPDEESTTSEDF